MLTWGNSFIALGVFIFAWLVIVRPARKMASAIDRLASILEDFRRDIRRSR